MTHQRSKAISAMLAGAMLLSATALPKLAMAQIKMPNYEITTPQGDDVLLVFAGDYNKLSYAIFNKKDPSKQIGTYAYRERKVSGDMDNADELKRVQAVASAPSPINFKPYDGPTPTVQITQAQVIPAATSPQVPVAPFEGMPVGEVKILQATADRLEFEATMAYGGTHKFVVDAGGNRAKKGLGALGTNVTHLGGSGSSDFNALGGKTVAVNEEGYQSVQFSRDGKLSMLGDTRQNGAWTRIQQMKNAFGKVADQVMQVLPQEPKYYAVLLSIAGRSTDAKPASGGQSNK